MAISVAVQPRERLKPSLRTHVVCCRWVMTNVYLVAEALQDALEVAGRGLFF